MVNKQHFLPNYTDDATKNGSVFYLILRAAIRIIVALYRYVLLKKSKHYVIVEIRNGCRLGNQLFFISFGETLRKRYGIEVIYGTRVIKDYLFLVECLIFYRFKILLLKHIDLATTVEILHNCDFSSVLPNVMSSLKYGNVLITGFYEDITLHDRNLACSLFYPSNYIKKVVKKTYGNLTNVVSVHIRRGDFVELGIAQSIDWYLNAMSLFDEKVTFLINSDDIEWCKAAFENSRYNIVYAQSIRLKYISSYVDLFLPVFCGKGNIISTSTFSWWGAFLNNKDNIIQIAPYPWWNYDKDRNVYFQGMIKVSSNNEIVNNSV